MFSESLVIVSGKGGVGKSAIAAAIARRLAESAPTVLVTLDTQDVKHPFLDAPLGYEPVAVGRNLSLMRVEPLAAVREYVRRRVPFSGLYDSFLNSRMFRDFAEASPGFEELMCLGKLYDLVSSSPFERVVFDAPATGHMMTLIEVPAATLEAVKVGALNHNARRIQDLLLDPERTRVVIASLPEEMAVREALELASFCRDRRMAVGPFVVNQWVDSRFNTAEVAAMQAIPNPSAGLTLATDCAAAELQLAMSHQQSAALLAGSQTRMIRIPRLLDHDPEHLVEQMASLLGEVLA